MNVAHTAVQLIGHLIDGKGVESSTDAVKQARRAPVFNPATGAISSEVLLADAGVVDTAVAAALRAFPKWSATSSLNR